jgi:hypothetical protein
MTVDEFAESTGSAISPFIWVTYRVEHPGKEGFLVGNFMVDRSATDEQIIAKADADVDAFYSGHMPDGTPRPVVCGFMRGPLRLYLDDQP